MLVVKARSTAQKREKEDWKVVPLTFERLNDQDGKIRHAIRRWQCDDGIFVQEQHVVVKKEGEKRYAISYSVNDAVVHEQNADTRHASHIEILETGDFQQQDMEKMPAFANTKG